MGNLKKPTALLKLEGTYRKDRAPKNEVQPPATLEMEPPADLQGVAAEYWSKIMLHYGRAGLVTIVDVDALHALCNWYGIMCRAIDHINKNGLRIEEDVYNKNGDRAGKREVDNPHIAIADRANKNFHQWASKFGLTPSDRSRLSLPEKKDNDEFKEFD